MPRWLIVTLDLLSLTTLLALFSPPLVAIGWALGTVEPLFGIWRWALLPAFGVGALGILLLEVALIHRVLPAVRPGIHPVPSRDAAAWLARFWLQRAVFQSLWRELLMGSALLRWLTLRALGGRVALNANLSSDVLLSDTYLVRIGEGALIGTGALLTPHAFIGDRILLKPIHVDDGAQIFGHASIGPGCTIGPGATVGYRCSIGPDSTLEEGAHVGLGVTAIAEVRIGAGARVGPGAILLRGTTIPPGARIPAGAVVGAGGPSSDRTSGVPPSPDPSNEARG